jgi:hypothetical protein
MGFFTWIKGFLQPQKGTIRVNGGYQPCSHGGTPNPPPSDFDDHLGREIARRRGSNPPAPGNKPAAPSGPTCPGPRRWRGPDYRVRILPGNPKPVVRMIPASRYRPLIRSGLVGSVAAVLITSASSASGFSVAFAIALFAVCAVLAIADMAIAWARQQQAQALRIPPPGADPVATNGDLLRVLDPILWADEARRALYNLGRSDERTAILRVLGVEP